MSKGKKRNRTPIYKVQMKIKPSASADSLRKRMLPHPSDEAEISRLYLLYREPFIAFALKYFDYDSDSAADVYQDSFLALYQNIRDGHITQLSASLKTYLFQIGKFKMMNRYRQAKNQQTVDIRDDIGSIDSLYTDEQTSINAITLEEVYAMKEPCCSVLSLYYWERQSMEQIAHVLNYKNEQVAKNRKSLCLKKLKSALSFRFQKEGFSYYDNQ